MPALGMGVGSAVSSLGLPVTRLTTFQPVYQELVAETVGTAPELIGIRNTFNIAADDVGASGLAVGIRSYPITLAQTVGVAPALAALRGLVLLERIGATEHIFPATVTSQILAEAIALAEATARGTPTTVSETVGVALTQTVQAALTLAETLGVLPVVIPATTYGLSVSEAIGAADDLLRFLGAFASDAVTVDPDIAVLRTTANTVTETVGTADALAPRLLLRATGAEGIGITPVQAVQMLFSPVLVEELELAAAYLSPGDGVTTWAMNARTGAVTEYLNYGFNSFARVGNKYLGASASGVYELLGDTDDGTSIVAELQGAFLQFGGTKLSRLKAAYLAAHGEEDEFVLKIETKDGATYNYRVSARDGRSTKVHMGKGQRARYFAYTLTSVGQDFNLDTLEFVPLVLERRV